MPKKIIYFDAGNVIFNRKTPDGDCIAKLIGKSPEEYDKILSDTIKLQTKEESMRFWNIKTIEEEMDYLNSFHIKMCQNLGIIFDEKLIRKRSECRLKADFEIKAKVEETLEILSQNYRLGILSNALPSRRYHELKINNIDSFFDPIIISWEEGVHKPDPKIYEIAIKKSGFEPENIIFVDDKIENLISANKAGIKNCILFFKNEKSDKYPTIYSFSEIIKVISSF